MSKTKQIAVFAGLVALVIARFAITANDSPDTILVPSRASASVPFACRFEPDRPAHAHGPGCKLHR